MSAATMAATRRSAALVAAYYFCVIGAIGAFLPYLPLMLRARGLSPAEVGAAMVVLPLCNAVAPPLWGLVADVTRRRILMLRVASVGCAASAWLLLRAGDFTDIVAALAVLGILRAPQVPLADVAARAALPLTPHHYGRIRLWGGVGFAANAALVGALGGAERPEVVLAAMSALYACSALATLAFADPPGTLLRTGVAREALRHVVRPRFVMFAVTTAVYYTAHAANDIYLSLHLNDRGFGQSLIGTAWSVGVIAEVILMALSPRLLPALGARRWLAVAGGAATLRWVLLAHVDSVAGVLATQTLHAVSFGVWYLALVETVQGEAPPEARNTAQAAATASTSVGMVTGYLLGGWVMETFGGVAMYYAMAVISAAAALLYGVSRRRQLTGEQSLAES